MDGRQQHIVRGRGPGAGRGPERFQHGRHAGLLSCQPEGAGQSEVARGGGQGDGRGTVFDQGGHLIGRAEVGLVHDAGLAVDARAVDHVVVEFVALFLSDEGCHMG